MKKIKNICGSKEFLFFVFGLYAVFWSWPFLSIFDKGNPRVIFYYLFFMWALSIVILFFIGVVCTQQEEEADEDDISTGTF